MKTYTSIIQGSINGNAATVSNGIYSNLTYSDPPWLTGLAGAKVTGNIGGNAAGFTGSLGGDVTGTQAATSVVKLRGTNVAATAPAAGQALAYNGVTFNWEPTALGGDVTGQLSNNTVGKLQNRTVAATAPTANQLLGYSGAQWQPVSITQTAPISITGTTIGLTTCAAGEVYKMSGGVWTCGSPTTVQANQGLQVNASNQVGLVSCPSSNQVLNYNLVGGWTCSQVTNAMLSNSTVTITAGTGLTGGGSVALGGSATLSMSSPVAIGNGGTGLTSGPSAGGQFLKSSAVGVWSINTIDGSDIATGVVPIGHGGTGSNVQNFVDLSTAQSVGGTKTFVNPITGSVTGSAASFTGSLSGDVTGTQSSNTVGALQGRSVSAAVPTTGYALEWSGASWAPAATVNSVTATLSGGLSVAGTAAAPTVGLTNCTAGQVLKSTGVNSWGCAADDGSYTTVTVNSFNGAIAFTDNNWQIAINASSQWQVVHTNTSFISYSLDNGDGAPVFGADTSGGTFSKAAGGTGRVMKIDVSVNSASQGSWYHYECRNAYSSIYQCIRQVY